MSKTGYFQGSSFALECRTVEALYELTRVNSVPVNIDLKQAE